MPALLVSAQGWPPTAARLPQRDQSTLSDSRIVCREGYAGGYGRGNDDPVGGIAVEVGRQVVERQHHSHIHRRHGHRAWVSSSLSPYRFQVVVTQRRLVRPRAQRAPERLPLLPRGLRRNTLHSLQLDVGDGMTPARDRHRAARAPRRSHDLETPLRKRTPPSARASRGARRGPATRRQQRVEPHQRERATASFLRRPTSPRHRASSAQR